MPHPSYEAILRAASEYPSGRQAAAALGIPETTFRNRLEKARAETGIHVSELDQSLNNVLGQLDSMIRAAAQENVSAKPYIPEISASASKPRMTARADGSAYRLLVIGDVHDSPKLPDKSRLAWMARHAAATKPDKIIQIGDFADFASCSSHEPPGSIGYAHKPSFRQDLESLEEALTVFYKEIGSDIPQIITSGNHEHRVVRWEENHPAVEAGFNQQLEDLWARFAWKSYPYGEFVFIGGCAFVHAAMNVMGKPYGGKSSENQIANDTTFSLVYGHTHRANFKRAPKIGPSQSVEILNVGSAMPQSYVAPYAGTATTGWSYGVYDIEVRAGHITSHSFTDMARLESLYGD